MRLVFISATVSAALSVCSSQATAQDAPVIDEIVVTATKREQRLNDVGQAVSALTGAQLKARGIDDLESLQFQIPNLNVGQQLGAARIALRGVGLDNLNAAAEGSIAFHGDGVFYSRPAAALNTFFDVERVEVLRGPQGTLYGRNATGGSVNVVSRKPTIEHSGYLALTAGNYDSMMAEGALSGPVIPRGLGRLAVKVARRDGFGHNIVTGNDIDDASTNSLRGQLQLMPSERMTLLLRAEYFEAHDNNYGYHFINAFHDDGGVALAPFGPLFGGELPNDRRDVANNVDPKNDRHNLTLSAGVEARRGDLRFNSISGYQESSALTQADLDVSSALLAPLSQSEDARQISQEFRLLKDAQNWSWLLGAYFFQERIDGFFDVPLSTAIFSVVPAYLSEGYYAGGRVDTKAGAVFGEFTRRLTDRLGVTLGARYSYEQKRGQDRFRFDIVTPDVPGAGVDRPDVVAEPVDNFSAFTPRVLLEYELGDARLAYASAARGFKSGGINLGGLQGPVKPELVWAYEVGLKADAFKRKLRSHLAGFYYDYTDLQVGQVRNNTIVLENAVTATIYGLEAEITAAPTDDLRFDIAASWLHAEYDDFMTQDQARPDQGNAIDPITGELAFQLAGNRLAQAPEYSINVAAQYDWPTELGDFSLRGEVFWVDDIYFNAFNLRSVMQPAHSRQNLFLNWSAPESRWRGQLFVRNLDGDDDVSNVFVSSTLVGSAVIGSYQEPRTFGVSLTYEF